MLTMTYSVATRLREADGIQCNCDFASARPYSIRRRLSSLRKNIRATKKEMFDKLSQA